MDVALHGPSGRTMLGPSVLTIGRAQSNQLVVNDPKASSRHAEIHPSGLGYTIVDLGSMNGTFVNDQRLASGMPRLLNQGDAIRIGDTTLTYIVSGAQQMGIPTSDGSTVRADYGYQSPAQSPSNTGYGLGAPGVQQAYQGQAQTPPYSYLQAPPPGASRVDSDGTLLPGQPAQPVQQLPPYGQPMPLGASGMVNTPPPVQQPYLQPVGSVSSGPPQQKKSGFSGTAILLIVLVLIIIIASAGIFFVVRNNQIATDNSNATATAQTSHNNATATVRVQQNATATVIANATATASATPYSPFRTSALNDTLASNSTSQWDENAECKFTGSSYQDSLAQQGHFHGCFAESPTFSDFAYQVEMTIVNGDCGGLIFRAIATSNSVDYYVFEVCQDGMYNLFVHAGSANAPLILNQHNSAIHQGLNQKNLLAVVVQGSAINLYVNNQSKPMDTTTDSNNTLTKGAIGVLADDLNSPTTVAYTNARVWTY